MIMSVEMVQMTLKQAVMVHLKVLPPHSLCSTEGKCEIHRL
jgi:hypothetical protein